MVRLVCWWGAAFWTTCVEDRKEMHHFWLLLATLCLILPVPAGGEETEIDLAPRLRHLVAAYPLALERIEGNTLVWKDATRMAVHDGSGPKTAAERLQAPDIKDMLVEPYPPGGLSAPVGDPGRARNAAFFNKMYGDCRNGDVQSALTTVQWLPKKWDRPLKITARNGVAEKLAAVSRELDELPAAFDQFLFPPAGTFNCRTIAGTNLMSAHGHGIAIDLATVHADYWRWAKPGAGYRNRIPAEIVAIFERHGFIWGGKWRHFDTMHFEYRPELLP